MRTTTGYMATLLLFAAATVALMAALPAKAQNPSEQIYLPYVAHVGLYFTDLTLTNFTPDRVSISLLFIRANASDSDRNAPLPDRRVDVRRIDPRQSMTVEIGELGINGQGMLIIDACKENELCFDTIDPASNPQAPRFVQNFNENAIRRISVSARIYLAGPNGTRGDSMTAVPWYLLPGADSASSGMDQVSIVGIRSDGHYGTQIGLCNGSEYSSTFLTAILYDGAGVERGRWVERLGPVENVKRGIEQMFPDFVVNRLRRQPPITSPWVKVTQSLVTPNDMAARTHGCENGCPRFLAYAAVTDGWSGDFSIIQASFDVADRSRSGEPPPHCLQFPGSCGGLADESLRALHSLATQNPSADSSPCVVVGPLHDGSYRMLDTKVTDGEHRIIMVVVPGAIEVARALCAPNARRAD